MGKKKILKRVLQVGVVVKDLDAAIKNYESFGIGPWEVHTRDALTLRDMIVRDEQQDFSMRLAFAKIGDFQWELIQPLDDKSIYAEFLRKHGEGLHHVAFDVDDFDETLAFCKGKDIGVLQRATTAWDFSFAYLDTEKALSCITEIYNPSPKK